MVTILGERCKAAAISFPRCYRDSDAGVCHAGGLCRRALPAVSDRCTRAPGRRVTRALRQVIIWDLAGGVGKRATFDRYVTGGDAVLTARHLGVLGAGPGAGRRSPSGRHLPATQKTPSAPTSNLFGGRHPPARTTHPHGWRSRGCYPTASRQRHRYDAVDWLLMSQSTASRYPTARRGRQRRNGRSHSPVSGQGPASHVTHVWPTGRTPGACRRCDLFRSGGWRRPGQTAASKCGPREAREEGRRA